MISWRDGAGALYRGSLFATFAALARGEAWSFPALRPHQREPWHAFTVQVAALALIRSGTDALPECEAGWRELLLALTPGQPEAWQLVVDDWSKPALLQPPLVVDAARNELKNCVETPDALDVLATAKNHDVKQRRIAAAADEDWLFALVTLQTAEAYGGRSPPEMFFHGVSRMNGGVSTRMTFALRPSGGAGSAFRRDVLGLVELAKAKPQRTDGIALLWTLPWDGRLSLALPDLDPLYVEVCRRVRFSQQGGGIVAWGCASHVPRVNQQGVNGRTGDPWAPMKADASASHTQTTSLGYRAMARLLNKEEIVLPSLAGVRNSDDANGLSIVAAALVRGQGKTEGLHRRAIRTSRVREIEATGDVEVLDRMGDVAQRRAKDAAEAAGQLRRALISLVQGGPEKARLDDTAAAAKIVPWMRRFDRLVDGDEVFGFFDEGFWAEAAEATEHPQLKWRQRLSDIARAIFDEAAVEAPRTEVRRIWAIARAKSVLEGQLTNWLKGVAG